MSEVSSTFRVRCLRSLCALLNQLLDRSGLYAFGAMLGVYSMNDPRIARRVPREVGTRAPLLMRVLTRWDELSRRRVGLELPQVARVLLLLLAGLAASLGSAAYLWDARSRALEAEFWTRTDEHVKAIRSSTLKSLEALLAIGAFMESTRGSAPSRAEFAEFVRGPLERLPEVSAFEWIPVVEHSAREEVEAEARRDGYPSFRFTELDADGAIVPAAARPRYFPVLYVSPVGKNLPALGLDLGSHTARLAALERAATTGEPAATASIRLAQETEEGQAGFLVFVRALDRREPAPRLRGFALGVFRFRDMVEPALAFAAKRGVDVRIADVEEPGRALFESRDGESVTSGPARLVHLDVFGRTWELSFAANSLYDAGGSAWNVYAYPFAGLFLSLLIASNSIRSMRRTLEIERRVEERTEELSREVAVRTRAEAALRVTEARYRSIFENAVVGIFQTTPAGSYIDANPALARIYGYASPEEFMASVRDVGRQLYVDPERRVRFTEIMRERGSLSDFVSEVYRKDGSRIWISETAVSVLDPEGKLLYDEGSVQEVTERVRWEEAQRKSYEDLELRVSERTRELADANQKLQAEIVIRKRAQEEAANARQAQANFLASMSHEIRSPLNAILGYSQLLQQQPPNPALEKEALSAIHQSGQHLLALVTDVMELSKIEAGRVELVLGDFNLGSLISTLSFMFRNKCERKGLKLRVEGLGASPWWVRGDEVKLRQVLINLLGNAVKFTERGEVRLRVVPDEDGCFRFEVIDTGIGIPADEHERIFGRFVQADSPQRVEGAGLGLAISQRLVEVMGGKLAVRSTPGWGSNFHLTLRLDPPLAVRPSETKAHNPRVHLSPETPCRALVVDDLEVNRNVMRHLLVALGCSVEVADSGAAALEVLATRATDVVFLDVLMPGMDGIEVAREVREKYGAGIKLIACSASVLGTQREAYLAAGFDEFIPKPFRTDRITDCLASLSSVARIPGMS
jgi:PAS domain S-box-containing protein